MPSQTRDIFSYYLSIRRSHSVLSVAFIKAMRSPLPSMTGFSTSRAPSVSLGEKTNSTAPSSASTRHHESFVCIAPRYQSFRKVVEVTNCGTAQYATGLLFEGSQTHLSATVLMSSERICALSVACAKRVSVPPADAPKMTAVEEARGKNVSPGTSCTLGASDPSLFSSYAKPDTLSAGFRVKNTLPSPRAIGFQSDSGDVKMIFGLPPLQDERTATPSPVSFFTRYKIPCVLGSGP